MSTDRYAGSDEERARPRTDPAERARAMSRRVPPRVFVGVMSLAAISVTLGIQAVSPALPVLQDTFDLNDAEIGWFMTAYVLPGVFLTVPLGILADSLGRRRLFCTALIGYGCVAVVQAVIHHYPTILATRVVQGICFAAAMPMTITLIGQAFDRTERIRALATRNALLIGGSVVLPLGGAALVGISWRAPLAVQAVAIPLGVYCFFILGDRGPRLARTGYTRDLISVARSQPGMSAVLLTAFVKYSYKFAMFSYLPILLVNERDASVTQAGIVISLASVAAVVSTSRVPGIVRRVKPSKAVLAAVSTSALAIALFGVVPDWRWALAVAVLLGAGDGMLSVLQDTYAIHTAQAHVAAGMVSLSQAARNLGKVLGPLFMSAAVAILSLGSAFVALAVVGLAAIPLLLPLRKIDGELQVAESDPAPEIGVAVE